MTKSEALVKHIKILLVDKQAQLARLKADIKEWETRLKMAEYSVHK